MTLLFRTHSNRKHPIVRLLDMEACKQYYNTKYVRLPDLLIDLEMARADGNYRKVMAKYANPLVLIFDERFLLKPTDSEQKELFELLHHRRRNGGLDFLFIQLNLILSKRCIFVEFYN